MIVGVAIRIGDRVYALPRPARHMHLFKEYNDQVFAEHGLKYGNTTRFVGWPSDEIREGEQGFVDDNGQFLTREEARQHAIVYDQAGATLRDYGLFSEDIW